MTVLDKVIAYISPVAEARRLRARILADQLRPIADKARRSYEGASRGRRTDGWRTSSGSAKAEVAQGQGLLRDRARDLVRNNPWADRGVRVIVSNTIAIGIIPRVHAESPRRAKAVQDLWRRWAGTTACDAAGQHDFYGLQALALREVVEAGAVLVQRVWRTDPALPVPMQLRVIEHDLLDKSRDGATGTGGRIVGGVELDGDDRVVAYWLYPQHPGDTMIYMRGLTSKRVPASEIMHIFRTDRAGQVDGITWLAPAIVRLKDLDDYEDAQLMRQKIAACFAAFMRDVEGLEDASNTTDATVKGLSMIQPGTIEVLPPGRDITFATPPPAEGFSDFQRAFLRSIAAAFGITYEALTGDYSNVNFSSGRMGWIEMSRNVDQWQSQLMIGKFCNPAFAWFLDAAELAGVAKGGVDVVWTPPRREMIDPVKETEAIKQQLRNGLKTLPEALRELGYDPEDVLEELASTNAVLDKLGIILDSDPRRRSSSGSDPTGSRPSGGGEAAAGKEDDAGDDSASA
jgi:lambda family phage portal protein